LPPLIFPHPDFNAFPMDITLERLLEFVGNHWFMTSALIIVAILLIQDILDSLLRKHKSVTPHQAVLLMNDEKTVVVDVREPNEFAGGHIEGARNIPLGKIEERGAFELEPFKQSPIIVACQSGTRSTPAGKKLAGMGFTQIYELQGGMSLWTEQNLPISKKRSKG
jgi:rhodanese-related sulfurtransferase